MKKQSKDSTLTYIEYGVHFKSNDGTEDHIIGNYINREEARKAAAIRIKNGNIDVYIVEREVSWWTRS